MVLEGYNLGSEGICTSVQMAIDFHVLEISQTSIIVIYHWPLRVVKDIALNFKSNGITTIL